MAELKKCSRCGAELPAHAPHGHCLGCLLQLGLATVQKSSEASGSTSQPGSRIDRYTLFEEIGEGGFGIVFRAEQTDPVRREVALKIIKPGMDTRAVIGRFEIERQSLALMDHPNIAKVFDAGTTETGRPNFVMELVRGKKITDYCDERKLSPRARLELFIPVCHAIQHAHQKGIIHRDLKPSNILIAEQDGKPVPKIIDFGIAKAVNGEQLTQETLFTAFEQFIGTPAYMSPEQAGFGGLDIDTRSDIYSLGVLLYELLAGRPPFEIRDLGYAAFNEILRIIRETEPVRPSLRLTTLTRDELGTIAERRATEPVKLPKFVRGDLDWIVMKALEKDRTRRYDTVTGLANDLNRYLKNEPVFARPPSELYRLRKWIRRNRFLFIATVSVLVALSIGLFTAFVFIVQRNIALTFQDAAERQESEMREEQQAMQQNQIVLHEILASKWGLVKTFDAAADFSITNGNPNGAWSYVQSGNTTDNSEMIGKAEHQPQGDVWRPAMSDHALPLVGENFSSEEKGGWPPHLLILHPGSGGYGEVAHAIWTAPADGTYWVSARFELLSDKGDLYAAIVRNLPSSATLLTSDWLRRENRVLAYYANLRLNKGDQLNFSTGLGRHRKNWADTTALSVMIQQYAPPH